MQPRPNSRRRLIVAHLEHAKIVPEGIERDQVGGVSSFLLNAFVRIHKTHSSELHKTLRTSPAMAAGIRNASMVNGECGLAYRATRGRGARLARVGQTAALTAPRRVTAEVPVPSQPKRIAQVKPCRSSSI